jgi:glutamate:GABA antiporter
MTDRSTVVANTGTAAHDSGVATTEPPTMSLKRTLGIRDVVLFNLVAILGLRWIATAAKAGPSAIILWIVAALMFFIPQGLAVAELSARYPAEGGIYAWTKQRFGERHAYLCGWCYWVVNVLYYPQLLLSTAIVALYVVGKGDSGLGDQWLYVLPTTLCALWIAVGFNIVGLNTGKWLQNAGGLGSYVTGSILVAVGIACVLTSHPANDLSLHAFLPSVKSLDTISLWATIAFAFSGLELGASLGGEIKDPRRTLPRAVYLSTPLIAGLYILGTAAVLWIVPTGSLNVVTGFLQGIQVGAARFGHWLWWLAPLAAAAYTLGNIGGTGAWLTGPARIAFVIGLDRYFPPAFARVHPKWGTPYVAILVQAVVASILMLVSQLGKGTTVEQFYLVLLFAQVLIYFIPFIYLFLCLLVEPTHVPGAPTVVPAGAAGKIICALAGLFVTVVAMVLAAVPGADSGPVMIYETKVVGVAGAFILFGGLLYLWANRHGRPVQRIAIETAGPPSD